MEYGLLSGAKSRFITIHINRLWIVTCNREKHLRGSDRQPSGQYKGQRMNQQQSAEINSVGHDPVNKLTWCPVYGCRTKEVRACQPRDPIGHRRLATIARVGMRSAINWYFPNQVDYTCEEEGLPSNRGIVSSWSFRFVFASLRTAAFALSSLFSQVFFP